MSTGPPTGSPDDREVIMQLGSQNPPEEPKDQMNERQAVHQVLTHIGSGSELETEREQSEEGAAVDQVITHLGGPMDAEMDEPERVITHLGQKPAPEGTGVSDAAEEEAIQLAESLPDELLPKFLVQGKKKTRNMGEMSVLEAMEEIKKSSKSKFPESIEAHFRLLADSRRGDQLVRGMAVLPFGTGRQMKIAVFAEGAAAEEAKAAGADLIGSQSLVKEVQDTSGGVLNKIDKCIATHDMMKHLGKVARILGPKGLMPNPKMGTVTVNVGQAVKEMKKGKVEFRADKEGNVHAGIGKVTFATEDLHTNFGALGAAIMRARPPGLKGSGLSGYVDTISLCSTMGPGIRVTTASFLQAVQTTKD